MSDTIKSPPAERRFGARVRAALWITVRGLHHEPRLVTGDVSLSGVFFEVDHSLGKVGSILALGELQVSGGGQTWLDVDGWIL